MDLARCVLGYDAPQYRCMEAVSQGGADDPQNLLAVCGICHQHLIHTGHVRVWG